MIARKHLLANEIIRDDAHTFIVRVGLVILYPLQDPHKDDDQNEIDSPDRPDGP